MVNPYAGRPDSSFWKTAVANSRETVPTGLYKPRWTISKDQRVATAGSCFAQHIGRHLRSHGFSVMDVEPAPAGLNAAHHHRYGYALYSGRYGNIYTVRQLLQIARECFGEFQPADHVWKGPGDRYWDAIRPGVEPAGLDSPGEVLAHRRFHVAKLQRMFEEMDVFIFTMGLTEAWVHTQSATVYPVAPGVMAGDYDPSIHHFVNFDYQSVVDDFTVFRELVKRRSTRNPKFLLTVSPVPLTATASDDHVLLATVHSKSVLRAAAGSLRDRFEDVDYFPSYEIVINPWTGIDAYEANGRSVKAEAVEAVMRTFIGAQTVDPSQSPSKAVQATVSLPISLPGMPERDENLICEEEILDAFAGRVG